MASRRVSVLAFGGNALIKAGQKGTVAEQSINANHLSLVLSRYLRDQSKFHPTSNSAKPFSLCLVHGNGPQVGNIVRQQEATADSIPRLTMDCAVAMTQGSMGYLIQRALRDKLDTEGQAQIPVSSLITEVLVDAKDKTCINSKAVGRFYQKETAIQLQRELGWAMQEEPGRGWRQIVKSPKPLDILHLDAIAALINAGHVVIAAGGGGVPVYKDEFNQLQGLDAVIDKDYTAALVAAKLNAELLVLATNVDKVSTDYGTPRQKALDSLTVDEAEFLLAKGDQFLAGTMGPKVESAIEFLRACPTSQVLITSTEQLLQGEPSAGTRIYGKDSA